MTPELSELLFKVVYLTLGMSLLLGILGGMIYNALCDLWYFIESKYADYHTPHNQRIKLHEKQAEYHKIKAETLRKKITN